jgi:hypothetical protein
MLVWFNHNHDHVAWLEITQECLFAIILYDLGNCYIELGFHFFSLRLDLSILKGSKIIVRENVT